MMKAKKLLKLEKRTGFDILWFWKSEMIVEFVVATGDEGHCHWILNKLTDELYLAENPLWPCRSCCFRAFKTRGHKSGVVDMRHLPGSRW